MVKRLILIDFLFSLHWKAVILGHILNVCVCGYTRVYTLTVSIGKAVTSWLAEPISCSNLDVIGCDFQLHSTSQNANVF